MGCSFSRTTSRHKTRTASDAIAGITHVHPKIDGEEHHVHVQSTQSGRFLLTAAAEPMAAEQVADLTSILEEDPKAAENAKHLAEAMEMVSNVQAAASPAFIGLLQLRVISASLVDFKSPEVQVIAEDDKSKFIRHRVEAPPKNDGSSPTAPGTENGNSPADGAADEAENIESEEQDEPNTLPNAHEFAWDKNFPFVFVIAFSHANIQVVVKDSGLLGPDTIARGCVTVADIPQGSSKHRLTLKSKDKEVGHIQVIIDYRWLRGTTDQGKRGQQSQLMINKRKLKDMLTLVSHVSNVNHWMLSHDNVWMVLEPDHPALKGSKDTDPSGTSAFRSHLGTLSAQRSSSIGNGNLSMKQRTSSGSNTAEKFVSDPSSESTDSELSLQQRLQREHITDQYEGVQDYKPSPLYSIFEQSTADGLAPKDSDSPETRELKSQVLSIFALVNSRMSTLEDLVERQNDIIMDLSYQIESKENGSHLPFISGKFGYGLGRPASKRKVFLFASRSQRGADHEKYMCEFLGQHRTDANGTLGPIPVPHHMSTTPGQYEVLALLPQDNTFARGHLFILGQGTKCVLFDLDGTITVGDQQVVAQFALNAVAASTDVGDRLLTQAWDQKARSHARTLCRLWAAKGYQVVYLSGRQGSFYNLTLSWLAKHRFPPGPIHLTRTHVPTLPMYVSVGSFKVQYMQTLQKKGLTLYAAYGNTGTDVRAYEAVGIPKARTFTIGQAAGYKLTNKITNWTLHLADVLKFPDADEPIPSVDLLYPALPHYISNSSSKDHNFATSCGTIQGPNGPHIREDLSSSSVSAGAATAAVDAVNFGDVDLEVADDDDLDGGVTHAE